MYAIVLRYKRPLSEVDKHVDAHRAWLRKNYADGTFLVSGRQRSGSGGIFSPSGTELWVTLTAMAAPAPPPNHPPVLENYKIEADKPGPKPNFFILGTENGLSVD